MESGKPERCDWVSRNPENAQSLCGLQIEKNGKNFEVCCRPDLANCIGIQDSTPPGLTSSEKASA